MNDTPTNPPFFLGTPGEPVVEVEPDELKTMWQRMRELQARYAGEQPGLRAVSIGLQPTATGKLDARSGAIWFRSTMISVLHRVAQEQMAPWMKNEQVSDDVFRTIAKIPMEWIGHTPREGLPFDVEEFFRRLREGGVPNG